MINNLLFQNYRYSTQPVPARKIVFGSDNDLLDSDEKIGEKPKEETEFNPITTYFKIIKKIPNTTRKEEEALGKDIAAGREVEEIIDVLTLEQELNEQVQTANRIKKFLKKAEPDKYNTLIEMAQEDKGIDNIRIHLLGRNKPQQFIKRPDVNSESVIQAQLAQEEPLSAIAIITNLIIDLKDGIKAEQLIKKVQEYEKQGKFTEEDKNLIQSGISAETQKPTKLPKRFTQILGKAKQAQDRLVLGHLKYNEKIFVTDRKLPFSDALQEVALLSITNAKKFDYTKGFLFGTYMKKSAQPYIIQERKKQNPIHFAVHALNDIQNYKNTRRKLIKELKRPPTPEEIEKASGLSLEEQEKILQMRITNRHVSLSQPVRQGHEEEGDDLIHAIPDKHTPQPNKHYEKNEKKTVLSKLYPLLREFGLDERTERILKHRFCDEEKALSVRDIAAKEFNNEISGMRVNQLEQEFLIKITKRIEEYEKNQNMRPAEKKAILKTMDEVLTPEEKKAIELKYGLNSRFGHKISDDELSEQIGESTASTRKLHKSAAKKLEAEGVTMEDILACREMPGIKELKELMGYISEKDGTVA